MFRFGQDMMSRALFRRDATSETTPGMTALAIYDPANLSTLFQDAAMTTPVSSDGDPVGTILDQSGNGYHLTQSASAKRPLYRTSGGLHWLEFDGSDDFMEIEFTASLSTIGIAMACRVSSTSHHNDSIYHLANDDGGTNYDFYNRAVTATKFQNQFRSSNFGLSAESTDGTDYIGEDHIYTDILSVSGAESRRDGVIKHSESVSVSINPDCHFRLMSGRYETRCPAGRVYAVAFVSDANQVGDTEAWLAARSGVLI